jgi:DNA-binding response OmpR family regulator
LNVLLVEDEASVAEFIKRGLSAEGWTVTVAVDGETASDRLVNHSYDIVLLDLILPGIDGLEVANAVRKRGDTVPILILTALSEDDERLSALPTVSADSLRKPFDFDVLLARMEATLRSKNRP